MDFQHRAGGKTGVGGVASASDANRDRRERLRQLALETIDLNKDPYFMKNHLGSYECKLCLTLHNNEGSYLAHTQGKKHQANLAQRAAKEAKEAPAQPAPEKARIDLRKFVKIGRPGYKVTKQRDPDSGQQSLLFQIDYPEIVEGIAPRHRFMAAYEQKIEPPDKRWQYLLFAAEPYETIAFKVPSREVDKDHKKFWTHWNKETKQFFLQFAFRQDLKISQMPQSSGPSLGGQKLPQTLPPPPQQNSGPRGPPQPGNGPPPHNNLPPPPPRGPHPPGMNMPPSGPPGMNMPPSGPPGMNMPHSGPPGMNMPHSGPPGMNMPHSGPPGMNMPHSGPPGMNMPHSGPPGMNMPPSGPPGMNMPPSGPPGMNMPHSGQPGMNMPPSGPPGMNMPHSGPPGMNMPHSGPPGGPPSLPPPPPPPGLGQGRPYDS